MKAEIEQLRDAIANEYAILFELEQTFSGVYAHRLSEVEEDESPDPDRCFKEVAAEMWKDVLRLEAQLIDPVALLDAYVDSLEQQGADMLSEANQASDEYDYPPDDKFIEQFYRRKAYWERVRYRVRRLRNRRNLGSVTLRRPVRAESGKLLRVEISYSSGASRVIHLSEGVEAVQYEDEDAIPF